MLTGATPAELAAAIGADAGGRWRRPSPSTRPPSKRARTSSTGRICLRASTGRTTRSRSPARSATRRAAWPPTWRGTVLRADKSLIKGLYAAGGCTEGFSSRGGAAYMSGNRPHPGVGLRQDRRRGGGHRGQGKRVAGGMDEGATSTRTGRRLHALSGPMCRACLCGRSGIFLWGRVVASREAARIGPHERLLAPGRIRPPRAFAPLRIGPHGRLLALDPTLGFLASQKSYWNRRQNRPVRWLIRLRFGILFDRVRQAGPVAAFVRNRYPARKKHGRRKTRLPSRPRSLCLRNRHRRPNRPSAAEPAQPADAADAATEPQESAAPQDTVPLGGRRRPSSPRIPTLRLRNRSRPSPTVQPLSRPSPMARRSPPSLTGRPSSPASPTVPRPSSPASRTTSPASRCSRTSRRATARR